MFHVSVSVCAAQVHAAHGPGVERALSWNLGVVREPSVRACAVFKFVFALFTELTREPYEAHTGTVRSSHGNRTTLLSKLSISLAALRTTSAAYNARAKCGGINQTQF